MTKCKHSYLHLGTIYFVERMHNCFYWHRVDRFYCSKCLDIREIEKEEMTYGSRPKWYNKDKEIN